MKPFPILHISDLHRSPDDPISNAELISALIGDRDRYIHEDPKITVPEAIVVSGDLIHGVPLGAIDYEDKLARQYEVAEAFLDELVKRFLDGDRSRLVIVPGNHDIDWNTAQKSFEQVDTKDFPANLASVLYEEDTDYRWDWKSLKLFRIADRDLYKKRLDAFWRFFERFYKGVSGLLSVQPYANYSLFSFCNDRIGVAAFNSCHNNDCYAFHGSIRKEEVAESHLKLKDTGHVFDLLIAVWHHSIEGPPYRTDYMDVEIVRGMIGRGFRLGLYGHQHKAQVTPHEIWLPDRERMAVVSAGSLCAGPYELPTGVNRQYNVLEISSDFRSVRVHVRSMTVANLFLRANLPEFGGNTFADLNWEQPKNSVGGTINTSTAQMRLVVEEAEKATKSGDPAHAVTLLKELKLPEGSYERQLLFDAASAAKDWQTIINVTTTPYSILELVMRVEALIQTKEYPTATETLDRFSKQLELPVPQETDLRNRIRANEEIKK